MREPGDPDLHPVFRWTIRHPWLFAALGGAFCGAIVALGVARKTSPWEGAIGGAVFAVVFFLGVGLWGARSLKRRREQGPDGRAGLRGFRRLDVADRRRVSKLARSGQPIADPADAQLTKAYLEGALEHLESRLFARLTALFMVVTAVGVVWYVFRRDWPALVVFAPIAVVGILSFTVLVPRLRRDLRRTADANGWAPEGRR